MRRKRHIAWGSLVAATVLAVAAAAAAQPSTTPKPQAAPTDDTLQTDRPGIADGSTVVGPRTFQVETGVQVEHRTPINSGRERTLFIPTLLRVGIDKRWEARVESNTYSQDRFSGGVLGIDFLVPPFFESGYSPVSAGVKYHFQDGKDEVRRPSLGAILRVFPPSGSGAFHTRHITGDFRLSADWDFAPRLSLNANAGAAAYEDDAGRGFAAGLAAATLSYTVTKRLTLFYDFGFQDPEERSGGAALITDGGAMYLLGKDTQVDFGIGPGVSGLTVPDLFWTVGISHRFR